MYYNYPEPFKVGVDTSRFNKVYAKQENSMWCWAACLEMIMRHNGVNISQDEFAKHSCGVNWQGIPNNCPASFNVITKYLNSILFDEADEYTLSASLNHGMPDLYRVYEELISTCWSCLSYFFFFVWLKTILKRNPLIRHLVL